MRPLNKRKIGGEQETKAVEYLEKQGYRIIERNFLSRSGEIDIIAKDMQYLVFVEVRFRSSSQYGYPEESISQGKIRHILASSRFYMYQEQLPEDTPVRFDVVAIMGDNIHLIKNAFQAG